MSSVIGRLGSVTLSLLAGQSIAVGSYGPGSAKISTAAFINNQLNPIFAFNSYVTNASTYITFAAATWVLIEASNGCECEYDFGAQPALVDNPFAVAAAVAAHAGGGQGSATPLTGNINRVTTVASAGDSVLLPPGIVGKRVNVFNGTATNSLNVFPQTGESIANGAANAAFAVAAAKGAAFECVSTGLWNVILSA
jgi:hypothetical protein